MAHNVKGSPLGFYMGVWGKNLQNIPCQVLLLSSPVDPIYKFSSVDSINRFCNHSTKPRQNTYFSYFTLVKSYSLKQRLKQKSRIDFKNIKFSFAKLQKHFFAFKNELLNYILIVQRRQENVFNYFVDFKFKVKIFKQVPTKYKLNVLYRENNVKYNF